MQQTAPFLFFWAPERSCMTDTHPQYPGLPGALVSLGRHIHHSAGNHMCHLKEPKPREAETRASEAWDTARVGLPDPWKPLSSTVTG